MSNLVTMTNGEAAVTSRQVAENFGKEHAKVIRSIEGIISETPLSDSQKMFIIDRNYVLLKGEELRGFKRNTTISGFADNLNKLYLWTSRGANRHNGDMKKLDRRSIASIFCILQ